MLNTSAWRTNPCFLIRAFLKKVSHLLTILNYFSGRQGFDCVCLKIPYFLDIIKKFL